MRCHLKYSSKYLEPFIEGNVARLPLVALVNKPKCSWWVGFQNCYSPKNTKRTKTSRVLKIAHVKNTVLEKCDSTLL